MARSLPVVRYFRQGVNRYRESRRCSSSSKLMQHLTFRYTLLVSRSPSSPSVPPPRVSRSCLTTMYLGFFFRLPPPVLVGNTDTEARNNHLFCPSSSFLLHRSWIDRDDTCLDLPSIPVPLRDDAFSAARTTARFLSLLFRPSPCVYGSLSFSRHRAAPRRVVRTKHPGTHVPAPSRRSPWNVKHLALYTTSSPFLRSFSFSFDSPSFHVCSSLVSFSPVSLPSTRPTKLVNCGIILDSRTTNFAAEGCPV